MFDGLHFLCGFKRQIPKQCKLACLYLDFKISTMPQNSFPDAAQAKSMLCAIFFTGSWQPMLQLHRRRKRVGHPAPKMPFSAFNVR